MARSIGIGIIGMGWMGMTHSRAYQQVSNRFHNTGIRPHLVICADDVKSRAEEAQDRFGFERCTTDWRQVIAEPNVTVVDITAPNKLHLEIATAAAEAGKHIFCEKPVGQYPQQTAEIEHAARRSGVFTFVGYNYRWAPMVQHAQQLVREGRLGDLTHYRGRFFVGYGSNPHSVLSWRFQRELAGLGSLGDLMSHVVDMSHVIVGPIKRVTANRHTFISQRPLAVAGEGTHFTTRTDGPMGDVTNEDYVAVLVQFENGAQGTFEVCRVVHGIKCQMAFEANGTHGSLSWDFERMNELSLCLPDEVSDLDGYVRIQSGPEHPFHANFNPGPAVGLGYEDLTTIELYQFMESIVLGKQGEPGFAQALAVAEVQDAIQRSWKSGSWEGISDIGRDLP